jgi:hypothetical protein
MPALSVLVHQSLTWCTSSEGVEYWSNGALEDLGFAKLATRLSFRYSNTPILQYSNTPILQYSNTPILQYSIAPPLHCSTAPLLRCCVAALLRCCVAALLRCSDWLADWPLRLTQVTSGRRAASRWLPARCRWRSLRMHRGHLSKAEMWGLGAECGREDLVHGAR